MIVADLALCVDGVCTLPDHSKPIKQWVAVFTRKDHQSFQGFTAGMFSLMTSDSLGWIYMVECVVAVVVINLMLTFTLSVTHLSLLFCTDKVGDRAKLCQMQQTTVPTI